MAFCFLCVATVLPTTVRGQVNAVSTFDTPNYTLGQPLNNQGSSDAGWNGNLWGTWHNNGAGGDTTSVIAYADTAAQQGNGSSMMIGTSGNQVGEYRFFASQTTPFWITQYVRVTHANDPFGQRFGIGGLSTDTAGHWGTVSSDGDWGVFNGPTFQDTGIPVKPMQWQQISLLVTPATQSFLFYVDGQQVPGSMQMINNHLSIDNLNYLSNQTAWVDDIQVFSAPEPSTLALVGTGVLCLLTFAAKKLR